MVGLHATGGSTNHTLHLVAIAAAAGIKLTWTDIAEISEIVPLLARVYPNGPSDVNHFHAAGGMGRLIGELFALAGLLHENVRTVQGEGLSGYLQEPHLQDDGSLGWRASAEESGNENILSTVTKPFAKIRGLENARWKSWRSGHQNFRSKTRAPCD